MPHALTPRQKEYLEFIREYVKENESSPRLEEIADYIDKYPAAQSPQIVGNKTIGITIRSNKNIY